MLTDEIKTLMRQAQKARDEVTRNILGLALGEIQTAEARANRTLEAGEAAAVVRKLVKANEETLALAAERGEADPSRAGILRKEIDVLSALLPKSMDVQAIVASLDAVADAIRSARNDGQAMGVAMKHLKAAGASVEAPDVQKAVQALRGSSG